MTNIRYHYYKAHFYVQNDVGVMARINVVLRKFGVNIQFIDVSEAEGTSNFSNIVLGLETPRDEHGMEVVMQKVQRLIPVMEVNWKKVSEHVVKSPKSKAQRFDF